MQPDRLVNVDPAKPLVALTATVRGMIENNFIRAAQRACTELMQAVGDAGQIDAVRTRLGVYPDLPQGPNDPSCRYVAGVLFGHDLITGQGACWQPEVPLSGSLAWAPIAPGRYAVFTHVGPYDNLHLSWRAIYTVWLPATDERLRGAPPLELSVTWPESVSSRALCTEIWIPLAERQESRAQAS